MPSGAVSSIIEELKGVLLGKEPEIRLALCALLARGHLLVEDLPGMGKTTLAHGLANCLGLQYSRVQFTSDLLPADILGQALQGSRPDFGRFRGLGYLAEAVGGGGW